MEIWEGPTDMFGLAIYNGIASKMKESQKYRDFINKLDEFNILVELDYYPLMMRFKKGSFEVTRDISGKANVKLKVTLQDFLNIVDNKASIIGSFLKMKLRMTKGFTKLIKVFKLFSNMMN